MTEAVGASGLDENRGEDKSHRGIGAVTVFSAE